MIHKITSSVIFPFLLVNEKVVLSEVIILSLAFFNQFFKVLIEGMRAFPPCNWDVIDFHSSNNLLLLLNFLLFS